MHAMECLPMIAISLGIGYMLCVVAEKQKGNMKTLGNVLCLPILIVSVLLVFVCAGKTGYKMKSDGGCCCGFNKMAKPMMAMPCR